MTHASCIAMLLLLTIPLASTATSADEAILLTPKYMAEHRDEWRFTRTVSPKEPTLHTFTIERIQLADGPHDLEGVFEVVRDGVVLYRSRSQVTVGKGTAVFVISAAWEEARRTTFTLTENNPDAKPDSSRVYRARLNDFLIRRYTE